VLREIARLSEPGGIWFGAVYPPAGQLTGDGGFFVDRSDGSVVQFGSGDWFRFFSDPETFNSDPETLNNPAAAADLLRHMLAARGKRR
jgi:hypothetical protein